MPDTHHARLPVEKNGGLTVAQIDNRIMTNNVVVAGLWSKAMAEHVEKIDVRFDLHEQKDALRIEKQDAKVSGRLDAQDGKLDSILAEVRAGRVQGDDWHEQDLVYRAGVHEWRKSQEPRIAQLVIDVGTVQTQQENINIKFNLLHWVVVLSKGIARGADGAVAVAERGKKVTLALSAIFSFVLLVWQTVRSGGIIDGIKSWIRLHH